MIGILLRNLNLFFESMKESRFVLAITTLLQNSITYHKIYITFIQLFVVSVLKN